MSVKDPKTSPSEAFLARRRRIFIRDWILALIALGLALTASVFRPHRFTATRPQSDATAPNAR